MLLGGVVHSLVSRAVLSIILMRAPLFQLFDSLKYRVFLFFGFGLFGSQLRLFSAFLCSGKVCSVKFLTIFSPLLSRHNTEASFCQIRFPRSQLQLFSSANDRVENIRFMIRGWITKA